MMHNDVTFLNTRANVVSACIALLSLCALIFPGNTDISVLFISSAFMLLCFILIFISLWKELYLSVSLIHLLLFAWLFWIITPIVNESVLNGALFGVFQCSFWVLLCVIYSNCRPTARLWQRTIYIGWGLGLLDTFYALFQFFVLHLAPNGFFPGKNTTGAFLMVIVLLLSGEYLALPDTATLSPNLKNRTSTTFSWFRSFMALSLFLMTVTMLIVLSRGVLLSFIFVISGLITLTWKQLSKTRLRRLLGIFTLSLVTSLITAQTAILHRIDVLQHEKSRLVIWKGAWHLWESMSWHGIGIFNFMRYYPAFSLPGDDSTLQYAHNDLLQLLIETGIPGTILLIGIAVLLIHAFYFYLKNPDPVAGAHIKIVSCFAALTAIFFHSLVDFNFYIISMNILIGCCLGYLNSIFLKKACLIGWQIKLSRLKSYMGSAILLTVMLFLSHTGLKLFMFNHYVSEAKLALKRHDYILALKEDDRALTWFDYNEIHSKKADLYMMLASMESKPSEKAYWAQCAQVEVDKAKRNNAYYSKPYFQQGLLSSIFFNDSSTAYNSFRAALKKDPNNLLLRLTFAQFLFEEQGDVMHAKQVLESGLRYSLLSKYGKPFQDYLDEVRRRAVSRI